MPEWGICAVRLDAGGRRVDRVRCRLISPAPDAALVLGKPVEAVWAQLKNALEQGDRACVLIQHKGGWRRGTPVTPDDLADGPVPDTSSEVHAALLALPQF